MISYDIGWSGQILSFSATALARFERHRQARWYHREAGGQLFARVSSGHIAVESVTGPRWLDRRTRHTYQPHRPSEQREIEHHHRLGLHFVGDWHTHAEQEPRPSTLDLASMADSFKRSRHALNAFLMVIVGIKPPPHGLVVIAYDAVASYELQVREAGRPVDR